MIGYIDSSVLLRLLLGTGPTYRDFEGYEKLGSSELLLIECHRVLDRYRLEKRITDEQLAEAKTRLQEFTDGIHLIEISNPVKNRAGETFPTVIGTLDAIHLATALLWMQAEGPATITIITHDEQLALCAKALGIVTAGT